MTGHAKNFQTAVSHALKDGTLIELIFPVEGQTAFATYSKGEHHFVTQVESDEGEMLVPVSSTNNLIRHKAVLLASKVEQYTSISQLLHDIQQHIHRYVDLSETFLCIASYYVLLSWVYDSFNELPYLRLRGDFGSGKTRALKVLGSLCYKPFFASGASTVSPIFHILDTFRGTLVLDEADFRFSDEKSELVKILNQGNTKGFPVLRTAFTAKKEFDPRAFHVFGPKIVGMRRSFDDHALESRFLTEEMGQRPLRKDIPINLPDIQEEEAQSLRNRLLSYRFQNRHQIRVDDSLVDPTLSPRLNQVLVPLLSVIDDSGLQSQLRDTVRSLEHHLYSERSATAEASILEILAELMQDKERTSLPLSEITAQFQLRHGGDYERLISNRFIGSIIRKRLHLLTHKSHGNFVVPVSERKKVEQLSVRYGLVSYDKAGGVGDVGR